MKPGIYLVVDAEGNFMVSQWDIVLLVGPDEFPDLGTPGAMFIRWENDQPFFLKETRLEFIGKL